MNAIGKLVLVVFVLLSAVLGSFTYVQGSNYSKNIESLEEAVNKASKDNEAFKRVNENLQNQVNSLKDKMDLVNEEAEKQREENKRLQGENEKLEKENKKLEKDLTSKREREKAALLSSQSKASTSTPKKSTSDPAKKGTSYTGNAPSGKVAYLTFDDGPSNNTVKILDILKKYGIKGTFFVNGNSSAFATSIYKRIVNEGHALGNHSYTHNYGSIYQSVDSFEKDFNRLENLLKETTGVTPKIMRYPGGSNNSVSKKYGGNNLMYDIVHHMGDKGYIHFDWNVDSRDATAVNPSKSTIISSVLNGSAKKSTAIVLFHDSVPKTNTSAALPEIIEGMKEQGYSFQILTPSSYRTQFLSDK